MRERPEKGIEAEHRTGNLFFLFKGCLGSVPKRKLAPMLLISLQLLKLLSEIISKRFVVCKKFENVSAFEL